MRYIPTIENLCDRILPATCIWNLPVTTSEIGQWDEPSNWSTCNGGVPGAGDTANIGFGPGLASVSTPDNRVLEVFNLYLNTLYSRSLIQNNNIIVWGNARFYNGYIYSQIDDFYIQVEGGLHWNSTQINQNIEKKGIVSVNGLLEIDGTNVVSGFTIIGNGDVLIESSTLTLRNDSSFVVGPLANATITHDLHIYRQGVAGTGTFKNQGVTTINDGVEVTSDIPWVQNYSTSELIIDASNLMTGLEITNYNSVSGGNAFWNQNGKVWVGLTGNLGVAYLDGDDDIVFEAGTMYANAYNSTVYVTGFKLLFEQSAKLITGSADTSLVNFDVVGTLQIKGTLEMSADGYNTDYIEVTENIYLDQNTSVLKYTLYNPPPIFSDYLLLKTTGVNNFIQGTFNSYQFFGGLFFQNSEDNKTFSLTRIL